MPNTDARRELRLQSPFMRGEDVTLVQTRLQAHGYSPGKIDGIFGQDTQGALIAFQNAKGQAATGIVNAASYNALMAEPGVTTDDTLQDEYIAYLNEQVKNHSIYVWGAQGQGYGVISEAWIRKRETSDTNANRAIRFWKKQVDAGYEKLLRAYDCSGLGMYWLQNLKGIVKTDMSSNTMMSKCKKLSRGELRRGDWVFRVYTSGSSRGKAYHLGYIIDDALNVVEAKGRDDGVVKRAIDASGSGYWNAYGRPSYFFPEGSGSDEPSTQDKAVFAVCTGASVNIRSGPGVDNGILGIAHKDDKLLAMKEINGWRHISAAINGTLTLGYMSDKYIKQEEM